jgi:archaellum biogenesis protein FlaJ (TadC family)
LPVIARGVTVPNFLENLLRHHFDEHRDEINELYRNGTQKRF